MAGAPRTETGAPILALQRRDTAQSPGRPDSGKVTAGTEQGPGPNRGQGAPECPPSWQCPAPPPQRIQGSDAGARQESPAGTHTVPRTRLGVARVCDARVRVLQTPTGSSCLGASLATCPRRYGGRLVSAGRGTRRALRALLFARASVSVGRTGLCGPCGKAQGALSVQCRRVATCRFQADECAAPQNRLGPWVLHAHVCAQTHVRETKSWGARGLLGVAQRPVPGTLPAHGDTRWGGPGRSRSQWAA